MKDDTLKKLTYSHSHRFNFWPLAPNSRIFNRQFMQAKLFLHLS
jgi:hypothetical protein